MLAVSKELEIPNDIASAVIGLNGPAMRDATNKLDMIPVRSGPGKNIPSPIPDPTPRVPTSMLITVHPPVIYN
jgi:hypothetical protein